MWVGKWKGGGKEVKMKNKKEKIRVLEKKDVGKMEGERRREGGREGRKEGGKKEGREERKGRAEGR